MWSNRFSRQLATAGAVVFWYALTVPVISADTIDPAGSLSGYVFADVGNNGSRTYVDASGQTQTHMGISGVTITLTEATVNATTQSSSAVQTWTVQTAADGSYHFSNLPTGFDATAQTLGTDTYYSIQETEPSGFIHSRNIVGSRTLSHSTDTGAVLVTPIPIEDSPAYPGSFAGSALSDNSDSTHTIAEINLPTFANGTEYNFGELGLKAAYVSKRDYLSTDPSWYVESSTPVAPVPEPATWALLLVVGLTTCGLGLCRRARGK